MVRPGALSVSAIAVFVQYLNVSVLRFPVEFAFNLNGCLNFDRQGFSIGELDMELMYPRGVAVSPEVINGLSRHLGVFHPFF